MSKYKFELPTLPDLQERKQEVRHATPGTFVKGRIANGAERLSRAGELAARLVIVNEALYGITHLCYEADTDGGAANVDRVTHRLRVPAPWGSAGWRKWGLRAWEAILLRRIMMHRQSVRKAGQPFSLFLYNGESKTWHLNAMDYDSIDKAQAWLKRNEISYSEWRRYAEQYYQTRNNV